MSRYFVSRYFFFLKCSLKFCLFTEPKDIKIVENIVGLLELLSSPENVYATFKPTGMTEDIQMLLELGTGIQTDRTVHVILLMQDIAEKHGKKRFTLIKELMESLGLSFFLFDPNGFFLLVSYN